MPRSSRHKSHRSHKHASRDARDRSDSEDNESSRYRKQRVEEARVSKDAESDKAKPSPLVPSSHEKSKATVENGDCAGKKRKERGEDCVTPDRWNGSGKDEGFGLLDAEKGEKSKLLGGDSKSRSSRRREGSVEKYGRIEGLKRRSEKEYGRREVREEKERDFERVSEGEKEKEREKKVGDGRHGKSDDVETRNQGLRRGGGGEEERVKKDIIGKVT